MVATSVGTLRSLVASTSRCGEGMSGMLEYCSFLSLQHGLVDLQCLTGNYAEWDLIIASLVWFGLHGLHVLMSTRVYVTKLVDFGPSLI